MSGIDYAADLRAIADDLESDNALSFADEIAALRALAPIVATAAKIGNPERPIADYRAALVLVLWWDVETIDEHIAAVTARAA